MNTTQLITKLSEGTREVHIIEVFDKPYVQLSVYALPFEYHDYISYDDILEIKGLDTSEMTGIGFEETVIKREDCPATLLPIFDNQDLYHAFNTKAFLSLIKGDITLKDYYLDDY